MYLHSHPVTMNAQGLIDSAENKAMGLPCPAGDCFLFWVSVLSSVLTALHCTPCVISRGAAEVCPLWFLSAAVLPLYLQVLSQQPSSLCISGALWGKALLISRVAVFLLKSRENVLSVCSESERGPGLGWGKGSVFCSAPHCVSCLWAAVWIVLYGYARLSQSQLLEAPLGVFTILPIFPASFKNQILCWVLISLGH